MYILFIHTKIIQNMYRERESEREKERETSMNLPIYIDALDKRKAVKFSIHNTEREELLPIM